MWFDDEKEGPGKFIYFAKRQCYNGEWSKGQPRCGTISNIISNAPGLHPLYNIPPIRLEDPDKILTDEKNLIFDARCKKMVGA
jgi:hypothetical protein